MGLLDSDGLLGLLDAASRNHQVIANNLANLDTPGYKTARLQFVQELEAVLDQDGNPRPGEQIDTEIYRPMFRDVGPNGNDVSLEREIVELNKNTMRMKLYLAVLGFRVRRLRAAINGK